MLFLSAELPKPIRLQSAFISENEVKNVVKLLKDHYEGTLGDEINLSTNTDNKNIFFGGIPEDALAEGGDDEDDEKYDEAKEAILETGKASTSFLQRRLGLGYARAARMMDLLEKRGIIGPGEGAKPREILIKPDGKSEGFGHEDE
jgi:S-DNA-T family DNA segregation ATPase FtsK/SpoIIIE